MDKDLFKALFEDKDLDFKMDQKRLNIAIEKSNRGRTASSAMFGGLELFEGKLPDNPSDPNSDTTMNDLREGGAGGPVGGAPAGGRAGEMGDPKFKEDKVEEGAAAGGTATVPGGKGVAGVAHAEQGDVKVAGVVKGKDVKEDTAGVAKTPADKKTAGVPMGTGDVKVSSVVKGKDTVKEEVGAEKVLGEFTDEETAKQLKAKSPDNEISNYKDKDGKDVWKVTVKTKPGMMESCDTLFDKAMTAYRKVLSEAKRKIKEEKDPLNAGLTALKNTIQNMLNFYAAGDMKQSVEYANLATKQAADIGANLQTMASAEDAAAGVHGGMAGAMAPEAGVSDAASATADSLPTGAGGEMAPAGEEMDVPPAEDEMNAGADMDMNDMPEEDVDVPEDEYNDYEKEYESIEEAHLGFKKLVKKIEGGGKDAKAAKAIAASVGRKKFGKDKFQAMAKKGKAAKEGKLPANAGDPNSDATMNDLRESKILEQAERLFLVLKLKEKKVLSEKEKKFITETEAIVLDEKSRVAVKEAFNKLVGKVKK